jgi:hypothetical protein
MQFTLAVRTKQIRKDWWGFELLLEKIVKLRCFDWCTFLQLLRFVQKLELFYNFLYTWIAPLGYLQVNILYWELPGKIQEDKTQSKAHKGINCVWNRKKLPQQWKRTYNCTYRMWVSFLIHHLKNWGWLIFVHKVSRPEIAKLFYFQIHTVL